MNKAIVHLLIVASCLVLGRATVLAADINGKFAVHGIGRARCEILNSFVRDSRPELNQFGGWVSGYITAQNQTSKDTYDLAKFEDADTLFLYVQKFCSNNPSEIFLDAVRRVTDELKRSRVSVFLGFTDFGKPVSVSIYKQTFNDVALKLKTLGYLAEVTKEYNPDEVTLALLEFQKRMNLQLTGLPDQATLVELLRK